MSRSPRAFAMLAIHSVGLSANLASRVEPITRLGQQRGLGHEPGDLRSDVGELLAVGGHVPSQLGEPARGIGRPGGRPKAGESLVPSAARLSEGVPGVLVRALRDVGDRAHLPALGMGPLGLATGLCFERRPQRRPVVGAAGDLSDPIRVGGQGRQMGPPAISPGGELIADR